MGIAELQPGNHGLVLRRYRTKGTVLVHEALVDFDGIVTPAHVKIPIGRADGRDCRVLFNEITGWLLARALKLPVAEHAGLIWLRQSTIHGIHFAPTDPGGSVAWVASTVTGGTALDFSGPHIGPTLQRDLAKWKHLPRAVAFDAWSANVDRNLKNFIRRAAGDYVLIDHDFLLTSDAWAAGQLIAHVGAIFVNKLQMIAYGRATPNADISAMAGLLAEVADALFSQGTELRKWWVELAPKADADAAHSFLDTRSKTMLATHRKTHGLIV